MVKKGFFRKQKKKIVFPYFSCTCPDRRTCVYGRYAPGLDGDSLLITEHRQKLAKPLAGTSLYSET